MEKLHIHTRVCLYAFTNLALILLGIVFTCRIAGKKQSSPTKGYLLSFSAPYGCGGIPSQRIYNRHYFTADTLHNDSTIRVLQQYLDTVGRLYDSLHGMDITFSDNTTYEYYLKTVAICHMYPPKQILPLGNSIHVYCLSKNQLREDSIHNVKLKQSGIPELDINYH